MANTPQGYGSSRENAERMDAKYDTNLEADLVNWIQLRTRRNKVAEVGKDGTFRDWLVDGSVLYDLIMSFEIAGVGYKYNQTKSLKEGGMKSMKQNENIGNFLKAAETIGVDRMDLFQSVNIIQNQNMAQVLATLSRLGSAAEARGVKGAKFGVKTANKNERVFDEATKQAGKGIIGLQMGTNKVASQSGMTGYGQGRQIIHKTN